MGLNSFTSCAPELNGASYFTSEVLAVVTFEQWIELMKVLGDPNGIIHHECFKDVRDDVFEYALAHAPRLEYTGNVVYELRESNGDCTLWLPPQRPCLRCQ